MGIIKNFSSKLEDDKAEAATERLDKAAKRYLADKKVPELKAAAPPESVTELYRDYADQLTATLRKNFGSGPPDPNDVTQQAFQKLIERGDLDTITNLKAFVWRIARNLILEFRRTSSVRSKYDYEIEHIYFPLKNDDSTPENIIVAREQLKAINGVLAEMPEKRRRALVLHRIEGLSIAEVGRRLGVSRSTAAQHVARAIADLDLFFLGDGEE